MQIIFKIIIKQIKQAVQVLIDNINKRQSLRVYLFIILHLNVVSKFLFFILDLKCK